MIQEVRVRRTTKDIEGQALQSETTKALGFDPGEIKTVRGYWIEGISKAAADTLVEKLLVDPIIQKREDPISQEQNLVKVAYKPGVMDPEAQSIMEAAAILGLAPQAVTTYWEYRFANETTEGTINEVTRRLLVNPTVQHVVKETPESLLIKGETPAVKIFPIRQYSEDQLMALAAEEGLAALDLSEMKMIQDNARHVLKRDMTDVEIATFDQTWSEHCGHKTFKSTLIVDGVKKDPLIERIKAASLQHPEKIISAFVDNAGVIPFYEDMAIFMKGETHNWPAGEEPYGAAMTRTGGILRDGAAVGKGGENLFNIDINSFAPPDFPKELVPPGRHEPQYLLRHNFYGIRDYGNRMGIPTVSASFFFHPDFRARCVSLGVTVGVIPENKSRKQEPKPGQLIVSVGGRTGRDGIGGASFSSRETTGKTSEKAAAAVQIGNPIEEKRMFDALIECRDQELIEAITDCGGGGYSSAIGEMGKNLGVEVSLDKVKLKYSGLSPKETWLSEAQERMIVACEPTNLDEMQKIMDKHAAEMTVIGRFTGDKRLKLFYNENVVCDLDMDFLHTQPTKVLEAAWEPPEKDERKPDMPSDWNQVYKGLLGHWNLCSVEPILRQYDHGVQGLTVLSPLTGVYQDVLNDGYVCAPMRGKPYGIVEAHSFYPTLNNIDPYYASTWVMTDALAKFTAVGGNYKETGLVDNFTWPKPTKKTLGSLDLATDGLCDAIKQMQDPCVSGKDSLSSTYKTDKEIIEIPPFLNITVVGRIPDVYKTTSVDFKKTDSTICLIGNLDTQNIAGSIYYDMYGLSGTNVPSLDTEKLPAVLDKMHDSIRDGKIMSCHAISRGGLATSLAHMCFGGDCGAKIDLSTISDARPDFILFSETAGCFLAEFANPETAHDALNGIPYQIIGKTQAQKEITVEHTAETLFTADLYELKKAWQAPMKEVIG